jgi:hypothetical protein
MRSAALTLMALSALAACADATDAGAPSYQVAYNAAGANSKTDTGTPFFTTDPAYFANPPVYTDPGVLTLAPYYAVNTGYFLVPSYRARYAYCPPRGYSHVRGVSRHR